MAQSVRRDIHRMHERLRFRPLRVKGELVEVAWYEPTHHVCEAVATELARREPARQWILLTPDRSMRWDGTRLLSAPGIAPLQQPGEANDAGAWVRVLDALPWP